MIVKFRTCGGIGDRVIEANNIYSACEKVIGMPEHSNYKVTIVKNNPLTDCMVESNHIYAGHNYIYLGKIIKE